MCKKKKKNSSSDTSPGLGLKAGTILGRQRAALKASKYHAKFFFSLCIPSVCLIFVAMREEGRGERGRKGEEREGEEITQQK